MKVPSLKKKLCSPKIANLQIKRDQGGLYLYLCLCLWLHPPLPRPVPLLDLASWRIFYVDWLMPRWRQMSATLRMLSELIWENFPLETQNYPLTCWMPAHNSWPSQLRIGENCWRRSRVAIVALAGSILETTAILRVKATALLLLLDQLDLASIISYFTGLAWLSATRWLLWWIRLR